jgi:hypothetical protein
VQRPTRDEEHGDDEDEHACSAADLVPGARVHEAELEVTSAGAIWEEVELIR